MTRIERDARNLGIEIEHRGDEWVAVGFYEAPDDYRPLATVVPLGYRPRATLLSLVSRLVHPDAEGTPEGDCPECGGTGWSGDGWWTPQGPCEFCGGQGRL